MIFDLADAILQAAALAEGGGPDGVGDYLAMQTNVTSRPVDGAAVRCWPLQVSDGSRGGNIVEIGPTWRGNGGIASLAPTAGT